MTKQVNEEQFSDISCSAIGIFFLKERKKSVVNKNADEISTTKKEFLIAAFSFPTRARSSAAVLQARTPLMRSLSLVLMPLYL